MSRMIYELNNAPLDPQTLLLHETLFHNANGYIGVRSCFEEGYPEGCPTVRGTYINGFYDFADMKQAEKLCGLVEEKQTVLNVTDAQGIRLWVGDEEFSMFTGEVLSYTRSLDMQNGTTARRVEWRSPQGARIRLETRRMASFTRLPLFVLEYRFESVDYEGRVTLASEHNGDVRNFSDADDPRVAAVSRRHLEPTAIEMVDGASYILSGTLSSGLGMCSAAAHRVTGPARASFRVQQATAVYRRGAQTRFGLDIRPGEAVTVYKFCVYTDSVRYPDCYAAAREVLRQATAVDTGVLYEEQRDYLRGFWEGALLEIEGDEELNLAVRFNLYQLIASVGKDAYSNMAAKGLSGEGYEGHYFWDTEMYIQPFFNLTNPAVTKNLIGYRYQTLDMARENAARLGHQKGALYPWRTIMGRECSGHYPSGEAQYHINSDIAYSVVAYYLATGDFELLAGMGAEILFETARLWLDTGVYVDGKFCIHAVTGPDEYTCLVNNNYYTNVSAQFNLSWAARVYGMLEQSGRMEAAEKTGLLAAEAQAFADAAAAMYLPYDKALGINPQDDSFLQKKRWDIAGTPADKFPLLLHYHPLYLYRHQVCKQADTVMAHFVFEDAQSEATIRRSFAYYEGVTTHDSSLSTCIFSIVAAKLGQTGKAYEYFGDSAKLDLFNTHNNTKDGIHTANMGGTYMAIVCGFGGLRVKEDGIHFAPTLPRQWQGYRFRVQYRGSRILLEADRRQNRFTLLSGPPVDIRVNGAVHRLESVLALPAAACGENGGKA